LIALPLKEIVHFGSTMDKILFENEIQQLMKKENVPGISIVMIENAQIESHLNYGLKNSESDDPIDDETVFEAASLSKPVFTYGIMKMGEEGLLNLDTPLVEYLPFPDVENDKRLELMTARMVLSHQCGFPNWRDKGESLKIYFQPGEKFSYSGEGFFYLQKVAEKLLKQSMEEFLQENLFQPLGMSHSSFIWKNEYGNLKASGHSDEGIPLKIQRPFSANAAFTLHTTALDYAKFIIAIMNDIGLKPETLNQMMTPQIRVQEGCVNCAHKHSGKLSDSLSWGLGWGLQKFIQGDSFWHWGDNNGFKNYIVGFRREKKGILIFSNHSNGLGVSIIPQVIYKIWGVWQPAFDWIDTETVPF
jgi:CubicO group peptidase (beta-lactamase class C family)